MSPKSGALEREGAVEGERRELTRDGIVQAAVRDQSDGVRHVVVIPAREIRGGTTELPGLLVGRAAAKPSSAAARGLLVASPLATCGKSEQFCPIVKAGTLGSSRTRQDGSRRSR